MSPELSTEELMSLDESQVNPKKYNLDDYESGYLTGYRRDHYRKR